MSGPSYISRPSTPTYGGRPICAGTDNLGLTGWATTLTVTCLVYAAPTQCPEHAGVIIPRASLPALYRAIVGVGCHRS